MCTKPIVVLCQEVLQLYLQFHGNMKITAQKEWFNCLINELKCELAKNERDIFKIHISYLTQNRVFKLTLNHEGPDQSMSNSCTYLPFSLDAVTKHCITPYCRVDERSCLSHPWEISRFTLKYTMKEVTENMLMQKTKGGKQKEA